MAGLLPSAIAPAGFMLHLCVRVVPVHFVTACSFSLIFIRCEMQSLVLITTGV